MVLPRLHGLKPINWAQLPVVGSDGFDQKINRKRGWRFFEGYDHDFLNLAITDEEARSSRQ
jgi:hypothetical protein